MRPYKDRRDNVRDTTYHSMQSCGPRGLERASLLTTKHRPAWHRQAQQVPRWLRWVLIIGFLCGVTAFIRAMSDLHDQFLKLRATDFSGLYHQGAKLWAPPYAERENSDQYIDARYRHVRHLASGKEGSVDVYVDEIVDQPVVVKTYQSISRNTVPLPLQQKFEDFTSTWPTELEAGMLLVEYQGFVPVLDYFILHDTTPWSWALVSSFMANGTLDNLAKEERLSGNLTLQELNAKYRPSLVSLLRELRPLHEAGLCHDDVKTDNIFIKSPTEWLLGDLGNIRQFSHPWHSTPSWRRQNQWKDCRLNDIRRAFKTYLWFLRNATADVADFDRKFWAAQEHWARLYWDFIRQPEEFDVTTRDPATTASTTTSRHIPDSELAIKTERELICTTIPRRLWPWYWRYAPIW